MQPSCEPFCEGRVPYSTADFPFAELALDLIRELLPKEDVQPPLEELHNQCHRSSVLRRRLACLAPTSKQRSYRALDAMWRDFVRDVLRPHLGEEWVAFEREPNVRVHFAHDKAPVSPHCDGDHFHSPYEVNFWIPLVDVDGTESLWAETWPGAGDFHPFVAKYGEAIRFYGNRATHFTVDNRTERTRVSMDARLIRGRDVAAARLPAGQLVRGSRFLTDGSARFNLFGYYGIMASDKQLDEAECQERQLPLAALEGSVPDPVPLPQAGPARNGNAVRRARSSSAEHHRRCVEELGTAREAQRLCARCGWMALREKIGPRLTYPDSEGRAVPWLAEQPDPLLPWGLGCLPCARLTEQLGGGEACSFSNFTFGSAIGRRQPLLVKALLRHGNHAAGQCSDTLQIIQRNGRHAEAVAAACGGPPRGEAGAWP